jgi:hypothetical protein
MSKIALSPNAAGTGTFTIAAPNSNTNRTLTLPDLAGTVLTDVSSLPAANLTGDVAAARITTALNATGSAPIYACRAWVNFNGTGTVAIRGSGNVSSITDNGTGNYTVNFTTAMPDADYCCSYNSDAAANHYAGSIDYSLSSSSAARVKALTQGGILVDSPSNHVAIFR